MTVGHVRPAPHPMTPAKNTMRAAMISSQLTHTKPDQKARAQQQITAHDRITGASVAGSA